jgi:hypothetical protein
MNEAYFLMSPNSEGRSDWEWTLVKVKVSEAESAYVAAGTKELAASLAEMFPTGARPRIVARADLPPKCYRDFSATRVFLINSAETLARYKAEGSSTFPYSQHIVGGQ